MVLGGVVAMASVARPVVAQEDLSDAEVAHVAVTANAIDAELAALVESRASDAEVREFARTMIRDHTAVNERAGALAGRLGVTPADNAVSRSLREGAEEAKRRLTVLRRSAFDRAYIDREVGYHQAVLDALDGLLIPTTSNGELRALLEEVRPAIAAHLAHAKGILSRLSGEGRARYEVEIRGFAYHPARLEVEEGDEVVWVNGDMVPHTATADGESWDSGEIAESGQWVMVATAAAAGGYICDLHPAMKGTLVVRRVVPEPERTP